MKTRIQNSKGADESNMQNRNGADKESNKEEVILRITLIGLALNKKRDYVQPGIVFVATTANLARVDSPARTCRTNILLSDPRSI